MTSPHDWSDAERVLCVRLDAMGDVIMTTPALRALKRAREGRKITLLTSPAGAEAAALIPFVDDVIVYQAPWMKSPLASTNSRTDQDMIECLRNAHFDAAAIFTVYSQSPLPAALVCTLAEIPLRLAHCRENPYQLLTNWIPEPEPALTVRHEVRRQLDLVSAVGCRVDDERMSLEVSRQAHWRVLREFESQGIDPFGSWIVIHPGATAPSRRYPPEQFAKAARQLVLDHNIQAVFTGSDGERGAIEPIRASMGVPSFSLAGQLSLGELAALLSMAPLLIANNAGPVHVAAAVGTPVVDLYALTKPQHTPWGVPCRVLNHDVPCKYCYKSICPQGHQNCLKLVPPEAVVEAVRSLLEETGWTRSGPVTHPPLRDDCGRVFGLVTGE